MDHKISVIVPVYNAEKTLKKCINSILRQTYHATEVILVDDGSTDNSLAICCRFAAKDSRIKVFHQENRGALAARKTGVDAASGDYISFLDADDYLPKRALSILYAQTQGKNDVIVIGALANRYGFIVINGWRGPCFDIKKPKEVDTKTFIKDYYNSWFGLTNVPVSFCGKLFSVEYIRKAYDMLGDNTVSFWGEDLLTTLIAMPLAKRVVFVPDTVYIYRVGGGTSRYHENMLADYISNYQFKVKYAENFDMPDNIRLMCDIEMCNVIHSYLITQKEAGGFSREELEKSVIMILDNPEIKLIISNPGLKDQQSDIIKHIVLGDIRLIVDDLYQEKDFRERAVRSLKRIIRH